MAKFLDHSTFFKNIKKPIVWTLHDLLPFSGGFHYKCYENQIYNSINEQTIQEKINALKSFSKLHVISISKWIQEQSIHSDILGRFPHLLISNGIDLHIFKPHDKGLARLKLDLPQDKKVILFVADSLEDKRKGVEYVRNAMMKLKLDDIFLISMGNGLPEMKD